MRISINRAVAEAFPVELHMRVENLTAYDPSPEVVILATSRDWLLARCLVNGFASDGYVTILRDHVKFLRTTKHRAFRKSILEAEGEWQHLLRCPVIDLESAATILRSLQKLGRFAILLRETFKEWHSIHCRVKAVSDDCATLHGFDGAGQWERRPICVGISDITRIYFGSHYLKLYQKYAAN